jgi:hypothetical protein
MNTVLEEGLVEMLDPLDTKLVDVAFTVRELQTVLDVLYFDTSHDPHEVLGVIKYLEDRMLDSGEDLSRQDFGSEYINDHTENEQYKRIVL